MSTSSARKSADLNKRLKWMRTALVGAGLVALFLGGLWDLMTEGRLFIGPRQKLLLLIGALALLVGAVLSVPAVRRGVLALVERSRARTASVQQRLRQRPGYYLLFGLWVGLAVGLIEVGFVTWEKYFTRAAIMMGADYVWMIPAFYAVVFSFVGGVLGVVAWFRSAWMSPRVAAFVLGLLGFTSLLLYFDSLHKLAAIVLAAGLAVQAARLIMRHTYIFYTLVRRTVAWLLVLVLVLGGGLHAWRSLHERNALAQLPEAPSNVPNVLLIVLDTVRAKSMSFQGYERETTPNLERLAERGVVFERAFSPSPWTLPAHGSMFTGRHPHEMSAGWSTPLDDTHPTLAEALGRQGYLTAGFVANYFYGGREFGLDRGFAHYEVFRISPGQAFRYSRLGKVLYDVFEMKERFGSHERFGRKSAEHINRDFLGWLSGREEGRPYFAFLNYYDAHGPYQAPLEFVTKFTPTSTRPLGIIKPETVVPAEYPELTDAYDGGLAYLDHHLGLLFEELEQRGELDNTIVIITSDHGELIGEHDMLDHAASLYMQLLHVPLLVVYPPHVPEERRIEAVVSLHHLPATVLDLTGLREEVTEVFPGYSLARHWAGDGAPPDSSRSTGAAILLAEVARAHGFPAHYPAMQGRMKSVLYNGKHYIKNYGTGREELYDLTQDLEEEHDLAQSETGQRLLPRYRTRLEMALQGEGLNGPPAQEQVIAADSAVSRPARLEQQQ